MASHQLAKKDIIVLYINLRDYADKANCPVRDDIPAALLDGSRYNEGSYKVRCIQFFTAVFQQIREKLGSLASLEGASKQSGGTKADPKTYYSRWEDDMCRINGETRADSRNPRNDFFEAIQTTMTASEVTQVGTLLAQIVTTLCLDGRSILDHRTG